MPDHKQQAALQEHNNARTKRGATALTWDDKLAGDAQQWAQKLADQDALQHAGVGIGENLSWRNPVPPNPYLAAAQGWLGEESAYRAANAQVWAQNVKANPPIDPPNWANIGHYAMLMSRETQKMGMGWAVSATKSCYVVARYEPFGQCYFKKEYL